MHHKLSKDIAEQDLQRRFNLQFIERVGNKQPTRMNNNLKQIVKGIHGNFDKDKRFKPLGNS